MKALVFEQPRAGRWCATSTCRTIAADEVLVRSRNVGICHSDFELYEGRYIIPVSYPIIPGHEWSGEIAEVGSDVTALRAGRSRRRRVRRQQRRRPLRLLDQRRRRRVLRGQGVVAAPIPEELSFAQGAFVEPFSVAYSAAVAAGGIDASDEVAVIGGGPIGLLCVMAAATMGGAVTLIEPQAHRRTLGLEIGARRAIDPSAGAALRSRWARRRAAAGSTS